MTKTLIISLLLLVACGMPPKKVDVEESRPVVEPIQTIPHPVSPPQSFPSQAPPMGSEYAIIGNEVVTLRVAAVQEARMIGLGGVTQLDPNEGMIFIYPRASHRSFWMKDCLIGLDLAYLDDQRRIAQLGSLDPPPVDGRFVPRLPSRQPVRFVVEMNRDWFARHGLHEGAEVRFSPALEEWVAMVVESEKTP